MISLFGLTFPLYGVFFFAGMVIAALVALILSKKRTIETFDFICAVVYIFIGALIGAKLLFIVVSWREIRELNLTFLEIMKGGFVFYGGLFGGAFGLWVYTKQFKENFFRYADIFALVLPLGHAFGRVGCLCAGCCYGVKYDGFCSITYQNPSDVHTPIGVPLLPVQGIESVLLLLFFGILLATSYKRIGTGDCVLRYAFGYAIMRFILEFLRGDVERGMLGWFSTSQWVSLMILLIVGVIGVMRMRKNR